MSAWAALSPDLVLRQAQDEVVLQAPVTLALHGPIWSQTVDAVVAQARLALMVSLSNHEGRPPG